MPKEIYCVTVNRPKAVTVVDMKRYIDSALNGWWGQFKPPGRSDYDGDDSSGDPRWGLEFTDFKRLAQPGLIKVATPPDRAAEVRKLVEKLWGQFYDKRPPGDPKDTLRAILVALERDT